MTEQLKGYDAVMSAIGGKGGPFTPCDIYTSSGEAVISAMRKTGMKKFICITTWGTKGLLFFVLFFLNVLFDCFFVCEFLDFLEFFIFFIYLKFGCLFLYLLLININKKIQINRMFYQKQKL